MRPGGRRRCGAVVMGCTEYELAADQIGVAVPGTALFGSAAAVAAQALRRALRAGAAVDPVGTADAGTLTVLLSGRRADLPAAARLYRPGRELALLGVGRDPAPGLTV